MKNQESFITRIREFIRQRLSQRKIITPLIMLAVVVPTIGIGRTILKTDKQQIYQVAVTAVSQQNPDPVEDLRSSLKKGDVLAVYDAEYQFSGSELTSYLILKMKLNNDHAAKLIMPDGEGLTEEEIQEELAIKIAELKEKAAIFGQEVTAEQIAEEEEKLRNLIDITRARLYFVDLSKHGFDEFEANDLLTGQPFQDKTYDWGIVRKKKELR
ncbi:hypothetical protein KAJ89_01450 [Candidatus Parcubacteria bacterium]|nr:hypothetical protein [Candidatus Parcubacteria bacterium]